MEEAGCGPPPAHTIVGAGDEHRILITPGSQQARIQQQALKYSQRPPKFSAIVNEYVGTCFEEHCNIGKNLYSLKTITSRETRLNQ